MADPVVEQIAAVIAIRIAGVTIGAGYNQTVTEVVREKAAGNSTPKNNQVWLTQGERTRNEEIRIQGNPPAIGWDQTFGIVLVVLPGETETAPLDTLVNRLAADVQKAIAAPVNWETFGGLAIMARFEAPQEIRFDADAGLAQLLPLVVTFRHSENDPYDVR